MRCFADWCWVGRIVLVAVVALLPHLSAVAVSPLPATPDLLEKSRSALNKVEATLNRAPSVAQGWRTYLQLAAVAKELDRGPAADPQLLQAVSQRLAKPTPGLDKPEFAELGSALAALHAQLTDRPTDDLWEQARVDLLASVPPSDDDVDARWRATKEKLVPLDQRLSELGEKGESWRKWLSWDAVAPAIAANKPGEITTEQQQHWLQACQLWNAPELHAAHSSLARWLRTYGRAHNEPSNEALLKQLDDLHAHYQLWRTEPSEKGFEQVIEDIVRCEEQEIAGPLTQALRSIHSRPNLVLRISRTFIERQTKTNIADSFPINDTIVGTPVQGTGQIQGEAHMQLVPSERAALLDVLMSAQVSSRTSSTTQGVHVSTRGNTQVSASKRLTLDANGLQAATTQTSANAQIQLESLNAGGGRVRERVAMQEYQNSQAAARKESESKTALYVSSRLDEEVSQFQQQLAAGKSNRFLASILKHNAHTPNWWRSTNQALEGRVWAMNRTQFAAPLAAPASPLQSGVSVQVHESFLEEGLQKELGGKSIPGSQLQTILGRFFGESPRQDPAEKEELGTEWTLHFAANPVRLEFDKQICGLTFLCRGFSSEKGEFPGLQISTAYEVTGTSPQFVLQRKEVDVLPLDYSETNPVPLSGRQQMLRRMVQRVFTQQMPPQIEIPSLRPGPENRLKMALDLVVSQTDNGWFSLVWEPVTK